MKLEYLIIGGGIGGTTAAGSIRKNDPNGTIGIISDEPYRLYSRIMLSKPGFFLGEIPFEQIWLKDENWYRKNNIKFIGGKRAVTLDTDKKLVTLDDGTEIVYKKLLLATGIEARRLSVPGVDTKGVFCVRTLDDGKGIIEAVKSVKRAVTVGGGFISFEMANLLQLAGAEVTVLIRESRYWDPILDIESSQIIENAMRNAGVKIVTEVEVDAINGKDRVSGVVLNNGTELSCDIVICGIGAKFDVAWLEEAGIRTDRAVLSDQYLKTNIPDVWAIGDVAAVDDPILEEVVQMGNWVNAQEQGRVVGINMTAEEQPFTYVSYYTTHGFGISVSIVGNVRPKKPFDTVVRVDKQDDSRIQLVIVEGKIVGAVLINQIKNLRSIIQLIESKTDVSEAHTRLSDANFDLKTLLQI